MIKYHEKDYGSEIANKFRDYLWGGKKVEEATIDAYCISVRAFCEYSGITDEMSILSVDGATIRNFVEHLKTDEYTKGKKYLASSINIKIVGINQLLEYHKMSELKSDLLAQQKRAFINDNEKLTVLEMNQMLNILKSEDEDFSYAFRSLMQTGMRASETSAITYESLENGYIDVYNKGRSRQVPMPNDLKIELTAYCKTKGITEGKIFNIDRYKIARKMLKIGLKCGINKRKLHPHNLRHFFALRFIEVYGEDAISVLADTLGHKSIETTRIYLVQTLSELSSKMTLEKLKIAS